MYRSYDDEDTPDDGRGRLTDRQNQVLRFIRNFLEQEGYPPTVRDIAANLNIVSLNAVRRHLQALEKKSYIHLEPGKSRGIQILGEELPRKNKIPVLGRVAAGPLSAAESCIESYVDLDPSFWGNTDELFLLRVKGDSMYPQMEDGDLVIVRKQSTAPPGSFVVALEDNEATVKQLLRKNDRYYLHPINPAYDDMEFDERFSINGLVTGLIRRM